MESFRKRYAYHLRNWQTEGQGITSHQKSLQDKSSTPLRVVLQPAGASEKSTIEMLSTDLVAELRAEVSFLAVPNILLFHVQVLSPTQKFSVKTVKEKILSS